MRRLDNSFFRDLTGGLAVADHQPRARQRRDRPFHQPAALFAEAAAVGRGPALQDGTFHIVAAGRQAKYGPVRLMLDGHIERPRLDLFLDRPNDALGIRAMHLLLDPTAAGFDYRASGGSRLGPFTSNGQILLPHGAPTVIAIAALDAGGAHASGDLRSDPGGFTGRLTLANGTLGGTLDFSPAGQAQRIDAHLTANNAEFPDVFAVRSGRADGTIILADERTTLDGVGRRARAQPAAITLARLTANAKLVNGAGQVRAAFAGRRGAAFAFSTLAEHLAGHASG